MYINHVLDVLQGSIWCTQEMWNGVSDNKWDKSCYRVDRNIDDVMLWANKQKHISGNSSRGVPWTHQFQILSGSEQPEGIMQMLSWSKLLGRDDLNDGCSEARRQRYEMCDDCKNWLEMDAARTWEPLLHRKDCGPNNWRVSHCTACDRVRSYSTCTAMRAHATHFRAKYSFTTLTQAILSRIKSTRYPYKIPRVKGAVRLDQLPPELATRDIDNNQHHKDQ